MVKRIGLITPAVIASTLAAFIFLAGGLRWQHFFSLREV